MRFVGPFPAQWSGRNCWEPFRPASCYQFNRSTHLSFALQLLQMLRVFFPPYWHLSGLLIWMWEEKPNDFGANLLRGSHSEAWGCSGAPDAVNCKRLWAPWRHGNHLQGRSHITPRGPPAAPLLVVGVGVATIRSKICPVCIAVLNTVREVPHLTSRGRYFNYSHFTD